MLEQFIFLRPLFLLLIIPLAALIYFLLHQQNDEAKFRHFMSEKLLKYLLIHQNSAKIHVKAPWYLALTLSLMILALSGPSWQLKPQNLSENQSQLMALLKVTKSMQLNDTLPSRLKRATFKLKDLLESSSDTKTALIAYSGSSHLVMPLTRDSNIIYTFASSLDASMMPSQGDGIVKALKLAIKELHGTHSSIVVFCDGVTQEQLSLLKKEKIFQEHSIIFYAFGSSELLDLNSIKSAADAVGGDVVVMTPDNSDIQRLKSLMHTQFKQAKSSNKSAYIDGGYYFTILVFLVMLLWFRRGLVAQMWRV